MNRSAAAPDIEDRAPGVLPQATLLALYRAMFTIRHFEETVYDIYSRGIMPGLAHLYTGMEAIAVGVCAHLGSADNVTSTHRGHGHLLAKGGDPRRMFAELLGKAKGPTFLECKTYRWRGHHMGDQGDTYGYRSQKEIESWMEKCPIQRHRRYLMAHELATAPLDGCVPNRRAAPAAAGARRDGRAG